ncbi:hypothetical protein RIdsm_04142 [Roseovarius indicus]|uniref:Hedgehog/Intein (Hint) domain-containing protein n=2 Tax=Roseovarius indicus TaxID=540747 RepID=A0A0T5P622_9RHOB|nr:Hint domain-containing protein [Roseovarius indicus]KRS16651.1 hypothetical protein XM52_17290 [Roseovarius indicus]QEW28312.1 hypothetical protein RIdsm_04142 [Roseovarius indicus]SFE13040.1 Hint domain-containing protein [Roseovarius indicus]
MVTPYDSAHVSARAVSKSSTHAGRSPVPQSGRKPLAMRKYNISTLMADGQVRTSDQIGPAMPIFESAFSAFSHGTLIATTQGQVAVEDLVPGMKLQTADQGPMQLLWMGSMTLMPRSDRYPHGGCLTRIMADSFGFGRPQADIMAGPGARFLLRPSGYAERYGSERALTPASQMVDGFNAIEITPPTPVTVYHLCLRRHAIISAGGMDAESFHPGPGFERNMGPNMLSLFLSFFPHIKQARDFGPLAHERLPLKGIENAAEMA